MKINIDKSKIITEKTIEIKDAPETLVDPCLEKEAREMLKHHRAAQIKNRISIILLVALILVVALGFYFKK